MGKDKNKEQDRETAASAESITSPQDAHQTKKDLSWEREARETALAKTITKAVAREMAKTDAHYQALLIERSASVIPTSLKTVEELHFTKQSSMTSGEFHSHIVKIAKRCQFPNPEAEERAIRDAIFLGMNSQ